MRRTLTLTLAVLALALGACSDGGGDEAAGDDVVDLDPQAESAPACTELVGMPTAEVVEADSCMDNGSLTVQAIASYGCPDGRTLHWNDHGWGYSDGTWQAHARPDGQLVPPDADMAACPG